MGAGSEAEDDEAEARKTQTNECLKFSAALSNIPSGTSISCWDGPSATRKETTTHRPTTSLSAQRRIETFGVAAHA
ncbi:hypothetical protein JAAARDRAFT_39359 [Jaapia argillacea MUCL 33604]|uniref:Uncharacterized protein n=1 Tax=Jaapia argillacea MUCL 33604 TaxID=933084 RepID=A0A067PHG2_9AGAM|nr:hypothetical protein JAAARDRAFT_39359 [Jaapia argillacea MUCL 33604]